MAETNFDIIVVGGGPGGYVAAIRAAQLGLKTAVVEREHMGGICLNWGCIPTKALLRTSEVYSLIKHADSFGLSVKDVSFDPKKIVERSRKVASQLSNGVKGLMKKNKIAVFDGTAKLAGSEGALRMLAVAMNDKSNMTLTAKNVILATGARARQLPGLESDGKLVWSYKEAMVPPEFPKSLLVIGSGAIGIEFASFYRTMGAEVTVCEVLDRVLPVEDEEVSAFAKRAFEKQGMKILTGATVSNLKKAANSVTATITAGGKSQEITVERVISAVGIVGNVENLGLESTKVKVEKAHIVIDQWGFTGEPNVYAIGDVAGPPWLAHKAMHEGVVVVEKIAGVKGVHPMKSENIPGCTYCQPQVASIGLTEAAAKAKGLQLKVGKFPFIGNGKAIALGEPEGFIKTIFDAKTGELLMSLGSPGGSFIIHFTGRTLLATLAWGLDVLQ
ncbi:MAG: dihydrolipoyl dehydrogenase, partial [Reyranella sp.]|nr:dihydrolipoyl dehydrogenase [Reyranella sp.]